MASPNLQENGIGGTSGDDLVTLAPLRTSGDIWYVDFTNGTDAASPAGKDRIKPLKTLGQAYTNAAAGDTIVFLSGHAETLTATQTLAKAGLKLISEATGSNRARFTSNISAAAIMFDITAAGVLLGNLYFVQSTVANATARVRYTSTSGRVRSCYFECGTADTVAALAFGASSGQCRVEDTTFASTSTTNASQPLAGLTVTSAMSDLVLDAVTFDGGSSGWSNSFAFDGNVAITRLDATNIDLLHDSDLRVGTGSVYTVHVRNKSGSARVVLTA